jgi:hypothetical protein
VGRVTVYWEMCSWKCKSCFGLRCSEWSVIRLICCSVVWLVVVGIPSELCQTRHYIPEDNSLNNCVVFPVYVCLCVAGTEVWTVNTILMSARTILAWIKAVVSIRMAVTPASACEVSVARIVSWWVSKLLWFPGLCQAKICVWKNQNTQVLV